MPTWPSITTVDLDHVDWLGPDRDAIGREKAGIARPVAAGRGRRERTRRPACSPRWRLVARGSNGPASTSWWSGCERGWRWRHRDGTVWELPDPALAAPVQYANAASAIAALHALDAALLGNDPAATIGRALQRVQVPARLQALGGDPSLYVDVGHNPQAARALAAWLDAAPHGRVHAVFGALSDKDVAGVMAALRRAGRALASGRAGRVTPRGLPARALAEALRASLPDVPTVDRMPVSPRPWPPPAPRPGRASASWRSVRSSWRPRCWRTAAG